MTLPAPPAAPRRLVYLGTPDMAVPPLQALHSAGFEIALVVTGADKRRGRRGADSPTPVKLAALALGLPVSHEVESITDATADLGVVVAFGQILALPTLEKLPMVNLHFSLLPRWRGAAPVERAILAGDERTGVCVMAVEEGLDTGGVYARTEIAIRRASTSDELGQQLTEQGASLLVDTLKGGLCAPEPQVGKVTYAAKIKTDDLRLQWDRPSAELHRTVRVGGAWTTFRSRRLKIHAARVIDEPCSEAPGTLSGDRVATGQGWMQLATIQPEGKAPVAFDAWANGARPQPGEILGEQQ